LLQDAVERPTAREVLDQLIRIDASTRFDGPIALFPGGCVLPASSTMISLLLAAIPEHSAAQAVAKPSELHIQTPNVQAIIQAYRMSALEAQSVFVCTASQDLFKCPAHGGAPFTWYNKALRDADADSVHACSGVTFLLVNALLKLPSVSCTVYRGFLKCHICTVKAVSCGIGLLLGPPLTKTAPWRELWRGCRQCWHIHRDAREEC